MANNTRFGKLIERNDKADFPFYNLLLTEITTWKWIAIILSCVVAFGVLTFTGSDKQSIELISRILFTAIPLTTFIVLAKPDWKAIFRPLKWVDIPTIILFWLLTLGASAGAGFLVSGGDISHFQANTVTDDLLAGGAWNVAWFYLGTFIQLFGEELVTILPFLAVLYWAHSKFGLSRNKAIILAWIITAITFGAMHLPTYGWNIVQAVVLIGVARLSLTLAYIRTKNIAVSFGAHLLNDWATFTLVLIATAAK